jgi:hypothetical protein
LLNQLKALIPFLLKIFVPAFLVLLGMVLIRYFCDIPFRTMTMDPVQVLAGLKGNPFCGCLSNFGVLLWCSAAAVCLFSAACLLTEGKSEASQFLLYSGIITLILMVDDFFLFHEIVFPRILGVAGDILFLSYFLIIVTYLYRFHRFILQTEYLLLVLAFILLGISFTADIMPFRIRGQFLVEDGSKFLGIVAWMGYFMRVSYKTAWIKRHPDKRG